MAEKTKDHSESNNMRIKIKTRKMVHRPPTLSADKSSIISVISTKRRKFWVWLLLLLFHSFNHKIVCIINPNSWYMNSLDIKLVKNNHRKPILTFAKVLFLKRFNPIYLVDSILGALRYPLSFLSLLVAILTGLFGCHLNNLSLLSAVPLVRLAKIYYFTPAKLFKEVWGRREAGLS